MTSTIWHSLMSGYASALVGTAAYVIGVVASFWLPEPTQGELPD